MYRLFSEPCCRTDPIRVARKPKFVTPDLIRGPATPASAEEEAGSRLKAGMTGAEWDDGEVQGRAAQCLAMTSAWEGMACASLR